MKQSKQKQCLVDCMANKNIVKSIDPFSLSQATLILSLECNWYRKKLHRSIWHLFPLNSRKTSIICNVTRRCWKWQETMTYRKSWKNWDRFTLEARLVKSFNSCLPISKGLSSVIRIVFTVSFQRTEQESVGECKKKADYWLTETTL